MKYEIQRNEHDAIACEEVQNLSVSDMRLVGMDTLRKTDDDNLVRTIYLIVQQHRRITSLRNTFNNLYEKWEKATKLYSDSWKIVNDENFQRIIALGEDVVPFLLEKQSRRTTAWFLKYIYKTHVNTSDFDIKGYNTWISNFQNGRSYFRT